MVLGMSNYSQVKFSGYVRSSLVLASLQTNRIVGGGVAEIKIRRLIGLSVVPYKSSRYYRGGRIYLHSQIYLSWLVAQTSWSHE